MLGQPPLHLNNDFRHALDVLEKTATHLFITGKAGTGKSTLLQLFRNTSHKKVAVLAPTGVAALNVQGQTIHSFFGFPPRIVTPGEAARKVTRKDLLRIYKNLEVLVIDEISMVRADLLDGMDKFLRVNRENYLPFGGVQVVFFGDLFQLPPVVTRDPVEAAYFSEYYESPYFFSGKIFQDPDFQLETLELRKVYRQESRHFLRLLEAVRVNEVDYDDLEDLNERHSPDFSETDGYITLCARNATADKINQRELSLLEAPEYEFIADVKGQFDPGLYPADFGLRLRKGAQVMFVRNDLEERQFVNGTIGKIIQFALIYTAVSLDLGFLAIVSAVLGTMFFNASIALLLSRRFIRFRFSFDRPFWRRFMRDAWPLGLTALITFAYFKLDTIILSLLQPAADVGIYNVAYKVMENLIFFPAMLVGLILPLLSRAHQTNPEEFREIAEKTAKVFIAIVLPIIIGTLFLSPGIISIVSGSGFEASAEVLRILIFSLAGIFFGHYFNMLILVGNAQKKLLKALGAIAFVNVSMNIFLIREFSYFGAAISSAVTEGLVVIVSGWIAYKSLGFFPKPDRLPRIFISAAAMAGVLALSSHLPFVVGLLLAGTTYLLLLWMTRAVTSAEVMSVFSTKEEVAGPAPDSLPSA